jgi:hypothetical protein
MEIYTNRRELEIVEIAEFGIVRAIVTLTIMH